MRDGVRLAWLRMGALSAGDEGFNAFLLRVASALRVGCGSVEEGSLMSVVRAHFAWLGDGACMDGLDRPLKGGGGIAGDQVFPLCPLTVNGKILRFNACCSLDDRALWHLGNLVIAVLNWLHGERGGSLRDVSILTAAHRRVHARIVRTLRESVITDDHVLSRGGLETFLKEAELYKGSGVVLALGMRGGVPDKAADVPLADHLEHFDPQVAEQIRNPQVLLLPKRRRPRRLKRGYTWLASSYPRLVKRNVMVGLHRYKKPSQVAKHFGVKCLAGAFAVKKDDKEDRVITDPSVNQLLDPEKLPRPRFAFVPSLRTLTVPSRGCIAVSKRDARHYFHRLRIGRRWEKWLCGPSIMLPDRRGVPKEVFPASRSAPMGFGPSAGWAQCLTDLVTHVAGLPEGHRLHPDRVVPEELPVWGSIIDDIWCLEHVEEGQKGEIGPQWLGRAQTAWVEHGVQPNTKKSVNAALGEEIQGFYVHPHGHWVGLSLEKRRHLMQGSFHLLMQKRVPFKVMERVIGKHGFAHSARPCMRSVFGSTYSWLDEARKLKPGLIALPDVVWCELLASTLMLPFAHFTLSSPWSRRVEASDASLTGLGRAFSVMPDDVVKALARYSAVKGCYTNVSLPWGVGLKEPGKCPFRKVRLPVERVAWKTFGVPWQPKHITIGEADAAVWTASDRLRRLSDDGHRFIHVLDSAAMVGALTKGRSSSHDINHRCRQVAAINLAGGHDIFYVWIPSKDNPADGPSRLFEPAPPQTGDSADLSGAELDIDLREVPLWNDKTYFFIHLCSGPRHPGDLLDHVEKQAALLGISLVGIAVDPLAVKGSPHFESCHAFGDLLSDIVCDALLKLIKSGRVAGGFGSPPCSTVSAARHMPLSFQGGPRPLRSRDTPWDALPYCTEREKLAVSLGSVLFLLVLGFLGEISLRGGWVGLGHPADRHREPYPSFFNTSETEQFRVFAKLTYLVTHQCRFGSDTMKPTGLLMPSGCSSIERRCNHKGGHMLLKGLARERTFRTSPAARFPEEFCATLATLFCTRFQVALGRAYSMPFRNRYTQVSSYSLPWASRSYGSWQWPEPRPGFLAEQLASLNHAQVCGSLGSPQQ